MDGRTEKDPETTLITYTMEIRLQVEAELCDEQTQPLANFVRVSVHLATFF